MATIAEKSRTKEIIERLQKLIETASPVPFAAGKVSVYKEEMQTLLEELASQINFEIKTYHEVNDRKGKIINEAKKEAEKIIFQAEHSASRMRVSKRATHVAPLNYDLLDEGERHSLENADEIYAASLIYTDEMLTEVTDVISDAYKNIRNDYEIVMQVLEEKLQVINDNKQELMNGLQEMETEDRGQQILEIGQLLSSELYNERMKHKMAEEAYDDGSVQLTLDFQKRQEELTMQAEERAVQAEQNLYAMQAERDRLLAVIEQMKEAERQRKWEEERNLLKESVKKQSDMEKAVSEQVYEEAAQALEVPASSGLDGEADEDVEYEVVYVTEDELEEGEEYEIEYVDELEGEPEAGEAADSVFEPETGQDQSGSVEPEADGVFEPETGQDEGGSVEPEADGVFEPETGQDEGGSVEPEAGGSSQPETGIRPDSVMETGKAAGKEAAAEPKAGRNRKAALAQEDTVAERNVPSAGGQEEPRPSLRGKAGTTVLPVVPRFKKPQRVASAPAGQIARMASAVTTDEKYNGLIGGALEQKEKMEPEETVTDRKKAGGNPGGEDRKKRGKGTERENEIDRDIRTDADGKEYVQAEMVLEEEFEIMEF